MNVEARKKALTDLFVHVTVGDRAFLQTVTISLDNYHLIEAAAKRIKEAGSLMQIALDAQENL